LLGEVFEPGNSPFNARFEKTAKIKRENAENRECEAVGTVPTATSQERADFEESGRWFVQATLVSFRSDTFSFCSNRVSDRKRNNSRTTPRITQILADVSIHIQAEVFAFIQEFFVCIM
jgi:hypothetical protein